MVEKLVDRLTRASLRFRWVSIGLAVLALAAGILALTRLNQELIPTIEFPQTIILAFNQGMEPEVMRDEVTIPIEEAVAELEGVINVESTTASGMAFVTIQSEFGLDMDGLRAKVRDAIEGLDYPEGMEPPQILTFGMDDLPLVYASVSSDLPVSELKALVEPEVVPQLEKVPGVADVQVSGGQELPTEPPPTPMPTITPTPQPTATPTQTPTQEPTAAPSATPPTAASETPSGAQPEPVPLPEPWVQASAAQGMPLETTADLTPQIVAAIGAMAPQMLGELTPEMLRAMPVDALAALPEEYLLSLDGDLQAELDGRLAANQATAEEPAAQAPGVEATAEEVTLPAMWQAAGRSQGIELVRPEDVTPEVIQGISTAAPQLLDLLEAEHLRRFSPEALAWLPADYVAELDPALAADLDERAQPAGGLGARAAQAKAEAEALAEGAPELSGAWRQAPEGGAASAMPSFETAADLLTSGFADSAAALLNMLVESNLEQTPQLMADLTPEVVLWLTDNEEGFLENLNPAALRLLSPEVLAALPVSFYDNLDPDLRVELEGIAAGTRSAFVPTETIVRVDGDPSLMLIVYKDGEANTVSVTHALYDTMDRLEAAYPGLRFDVSFEQASFVEESISGVTREGALGAVFAVVVILLFLSGTAHGRYRPAWRSTLVTAVSIPLSVFTAFALLTWLPPILNVVLAPLASATHDIPVLGTLVTLLHRMFPTNFTLNIMTLSGMTVAVGRVVDDSIVVLENIYRHIQRGEDHKQAVLVGTRDVSIAILASTVTTIIVFMPIGLVGGIVGEFFLPFGVTVAYALGASFVVAVTIIPILAYLLIRKEDLPEEKETALQRWYTPGLKWALEHRAVVLTVAALLFFGSLALLAGQPRALLPDMGEPQITVSVDLPNGTTMAETTELVAEFEAEVAGIEGLGTIQSEIGSGGGMAAMMARMVGGGGGVDQSVASLDIGVQDPARTDALTADVRKRAEATFGTENTTVSGGAFTSAMFSGFSLVLSGDPEDLAAVDTQVIEALEGVEGLANVSSNLAEADVILRVGGEPAVRYSGEVESQDAMGVATAGKARIEAMVPPDITVSEGFESEMQRRSFAQAVQALLISIVAVYLVMVITFRSLVHPFTILFSLPLALIGAAVALWLTNRVVGLPVLVGLMMLVGIVVTNAIVLIDRVQANRKKRGLDAHDALMEGGRTRLRPILMTAIATILALMPLAIGLTEGALIAAELATVVIGGLLTSTLLTLLIVPVMYSLLDRLTHRRRQPASEPIETSS